MIATAVDDADIVDRFYTDRKKLRVAPSRAKTLAILASDMQSIALSCNRDKFSGRRDERPNNAEQLAILFATAACMQQSGKRRRAPSDATARLPTYRHRHT